MSGGKPTSCQTPSATSRMATLLRPGLDDFGQGVFRDRQAQVRDFLQAPPAARDPRLLLRYISAIQKLLGKRTLTADGRETGIHDVLGQGRIAADVPLALVR